MPLNARGCGGRRGRGDRRCFFFVLLGRDDGNVATQHRWSGLVLVVLAQAVGPVGAVLRIQIRVGVDAEHERDRA